jgi:Type IV leader peptidase family.
MPLTDFGVFLATPTDAIRLVALPIFAWIAWKDIKTRRVSNQVWLPLIILGTVLLSWDAWQAWGTLDWTFFVAPVAVSLFVVIPGAYLMWFVGGFGGADAKAIMTLAILFPTYPAYFIGSDAYPVIESTIGSFSFTILANAVVVALLAPLGLLTLNIIRGDRSTT